MKAIVIFYEGNDVDVTTSCELVNALEHVLAEGYSQPVVKYFNEDDLSRELIKTCLPPAQSTEDGDASVRVITGMIPVSVLDNRLQLTIALTRQLAISSEKSDPKNDAFVKAMSIIAQGTPYSSTVAKTHHFNKMVREAVTEVYNTYLQM